MTLDERLRLPDEFRARVAFRLLTSSTPARFTHHCRVLVNESEFTDALRDDMPVVACLFSKRMVKIKAECLALIWLEALVKDLGVIFRVFLRRFFRLLVIITELNERTKRVDTGCIQLRQA